MRRWISRQSSGLLVLLALSLFLSTGCGGGGGEGSGPTPPPSVQDVTLTGRIVPPPLGSGERRLMAYSGRVWGLDLRIGVESEREGSLSGDRFEVRMRPGGPYLVMFQLDRGKLASIFPKLSSGVYSRDITLWSTVEFVLFALDLKRRGMDEVTLERPIPSSPEAKTYLAESFDLERFSSSVYAISSEPTVRELARSVEISFLEGKDPFENLSEDLLERIETLLESIDQPEPPSPPSPEPPSPPSPPEEGDLIAFAGGERTARLGQRIWLSALGSKIPAGVTVEYEWEVVSFEPDHFRPSSTGELYFSQRYTLSSPRNAVTAFKADEEGTYVVRLTLRAPSLELEDFDEAIVVVDEDGDNKIATDEDRDGDGVDNPLDLAPLNPAVWKDLDGDERGNFEDDDEDGDGSPDLQDARPLDSRIGSPIPIRTGTDRTPTSIPFVVSLDGELSGDFPFSVDADPDGREKKISVVIWDPLGQYITSNLFENSGDNLINVRINYPENRYLLEINGVRPMVYSFTSRGGDYVLFIDKNSPTEGGFVFVFEDEDSDLVPDDLEWALGCWSSTSDSDGDGIPDVMEIYRSYPFIYHDLDPDRDGIPNFHDLDSDGDGVPDELEGIDDPDLDGLPCFLDDVSDNDGRGDGDDAGDNPESPLDYDGDGVPDFKDLDDDGDLIPDWDDPHPRERASTASLDEFSIASALNLTQSDDGFALPGDQIALVGNNLSPGDKVAIHLGNKVIPTTLRLSDGKLIFDWPHQIGIGRATVVAYRGHEVTLSLPVTSMGERTPVLTSVFYDKATGMVKIKGRNLANLPRGSKLIMPGGIEEDLSLKENSTDIEFRWLYGGPFKGGRVFISSDLGLSNEVYALYSGDTVSGMVTLPPGVNLDLSDLEVEGGDGDPAPVGPDGSFSLNLISRNEPVVIFARPRSGPLEGAPLAMGLYLPGDTSVNLSLKGEALALAWMASGVESLVSPDKLAQARDLIKDLSEVDQIRDHLQERISQDPTYLLEEVISDDELARKLVSADLRISQVLQSAGLTGSSILSVSSLPEVYPQNGYYRVRIAEEGGGVDVINGTFLFLSVRMVDENGVELQSHISGYFDPAMVESAQNLVFMRGENRVQFVEPRYRSCSVDVVSPGYLSPRDQRVRPVKKILAFRTLVESVAVPTFSLILNAVDSKSIVKAFLTYAPDAVEATSEAFVNGNYWGAAKLMGRIIKDDVMRSIKQPNNPGPITKAVLEEFAKRTGKRVQDIIAQKLGKKAMAKIIPFLNWIITGVEVAEAAEAGGLIAKTAYDVGQTPEVMRFSVRFPLRIHTIEPYELLPIGTNRKVKMKVYGADPVVRDGRTIYPRIRLLNRATNQRMTISLGASSFLAGRGSRDKIIEFTIPGGFLGNFTDLPANQYNRKIEVWLEQGDSYRQRTSTEIDLLDEIQIDSPYGPITTEENSYCSLSVRGLKAKEARGVELFALLTPITPGGSQSEYRTPLREELLLPSRFEFKAPSIGGQDSARFNLKVEATVGGGSVRSVNDREIEVRRGPRWHTVEFEVENPSQTKSFIIYYTLENKIMELFRVGPGQTSSRSIRAFGPLYTFIFTRIGSSNEWPILRVGRPGSPLQTAEIYPSGELVYYVPRQPTSWPPSPIDLAWSFSD